MMRILCYVKKRIFVKEVQRFVEERNYKGLLEKETIALEILCFVRCKIFVEEKHGKLVLILVPYNTGIIMMNAALMH